MVQCAAKTNLKVSTLVMEAVDIICCPIHVQAFLRDRPPLKWAVVLRTRQFQDRFLKENIDVENINRENVGNDMSANLQDLLLMKSKLHVCWQRCWKLSVGNVGNLQLFLSSFQTFPAVPQFFCSAYFTAI